MQELRKNSNFEWPEKEGSLHNQFTKTIICLLDSIR